MNNKVIRRILFGVSLYALFVAAVIHYYPDTPQKMDWQDREEFNKVQIGKLDLGLSRKAVITMMGSPDITEAKKVGDNTVQVMFYRTHHMESDGITTMNECTPLLFEDDILVAWGEGVYQNFLEK